MERRFHEVFVSRRRGVRAFLPAAALTALAVASPAGAAPDTIGDRAAKTADAILTLMTSAKPEHLVPADKSYYVPMRDGVQIAISLWLPKDRPLQGRLPTVLTQTRYGRLTTMAVGGDGAAWLARGYAVVAVDARGTTASAGTREIELSDREAADIGEIIAHIGGQPWSNGKVIAVGHSYSADTADIATSLDAPALQGAIIREPDFDIGLHLVRPGGVLGRWTIETWGGFTRTLDTGRMVAAGRTLDCAKSVTDCAPLWAVLAPVDADRDLRVLRSHLTGRNRWTPASDWAANEYRDAAVTGAPTLLSSSPAARLGAIIRQRKPVQYWGSWFDAGTAEGALARYRSTEKAQLPIEVWISSNDHDGATGTDPFFPDDAAPFPSLAAQEKAVADFARRVVGRQPIERVIHYSVVGTRIAKTTSVWPPAGTVESRYHLTADRQLGLDIPAAGKVPGENRLDSSSGQATRWTANTSIPAKYGDRRTISAQLLSFKTTAFVQDQELAGHPVIRLQISSAAPDPAFFVYLEDVGPDGRVTYLTEGIFRAIHRKPADPATLPYDQGPAPHSFLRKDAAPMKPGKAETVEFSLLPIAARIRQGHRLQISIAGGDKDMFETYWGNKPVQFTVHIGGTGSSILLPLRPWQD